MLLASGHSIMATALQMPEIVLSEPEADALAKSSANVLKYYGPIGMGGKAGAWMSLATTMGMIYVPRVLALVRRKKEFEQARKNRPLEERPIPPAEGPMQ